MPLFKDLLTNLKKISMQSNKSNVELEKIIDQSKTSIKSIKYLKKTVKESKIINDESNKAFEEFNLSSNQFFIEIEKYLRNPTQEKLLKAKNQINESYNNLKIATAAFYESKKFTRKLVDSFNEYKKNVLINNAKIEKLIEWYQRLILSFKKNIRITTPTRPTSKLKTQTRKVYFSEAPTPSPDCPKLRKDLIAKEKERDNAKKELDGFNEVSQIRDYYLEQYEKNNAERLYYLNKTKERMALMSSRLINQIDYERTLSNPSDGINVQITRLLKLMKSYEIPNQRDVNLYKELLQTQKNTLDLIAENDTAIGSYTNFSKNEEEAANIIAERELEANDNNYQEFLKAKKYLSDNRNKINSLEATVKKCEGEIEELTKKIKACP